MLERAVTSPSKCLVCGATEFRPFLDDLSKCAGCGFVTAQIGASDPRALYEGDYFTGGEYLEYRADEAFLKKNFRKRLEDLRRWRSGGRLLELGAAYGFFLDLAKAHFQVVGFEVNPDAACHGREACGVDIRTDGFLAVDAARIGGPVDVVVMLDVIEHLERPDRFLAHIVGLTRPGALLYITTGDIGSFVARRRGRKWRLIHPPTHLHYFDRRTLPRLLERHGFRVTDVRAIAMARSVRQMLYSTLVLGLGLRRAYDAAARIVPASWGITLNTFDIMRVVAEKRSDTDASAVRVPPAMPVP